MGMSTVKYSVLSYYPSIISNENINVGILFHNISNDSVFFYKIHNWKRLQNFDDELDLNFLKIYLNGIEKQCSGDGLLNRNKEFIMEEYIKTFVNKLRFNQAAIAETADVEKFCLDIQKAYMRFDFDEKDRSSIDHPKKGDLHKQKRKSLYYKQRIKTVVYKLFKLS